MELYPESVGLCHSFVMDPCSCTILKALTSYTSQRNLRWFSAFLSCIATLLPHYQVPL
uniref:Uncharacterized protein n=1 Tax=Solanum tuberosum TaxID=4113 RepID=M1CSR3_SOLTU